MSIISCLYHYLNVAIGIINIYYNPGRNSYQLYHWPTIIYCGLFNLAVLIYQHFATYIFWIGSLKYVKLTAVVVLDLSHLVSIYIFILSILVESWRKRQRVYRLLNKFQNLIKYYVTNTPEKHAYIRQARFLLMVKCIICLCELTAMYLEILDRMDLHVCPNCNLPHTISNIFFFLVDLYYIVFDINIYIGFIIIYMCAQMLMARLRELEKEVKIIYRLTRFTEDNVVVNLNRLKRRRLLLGQKIALITRDECQLKNFLNDFLKIYQLQLFTLFLSECISLVVLIFFMLQYFAKLLLYLPLKHLYFLTSMTVMVVSNLFLLFNICEEIKKTFDDFSQLVHKIVLYASMGSAELYRRDDLVLKLEWLSLESQYRSIDLDICGFFEMRNSTCFFMIYSIVVANLLCVQQSVEELS